MAVGVKDRAIIVKGGRNRMKRPKTFDTMEKAQAHAKKMAFKKFTIVNLRSEEAPVGKYRVDAE